MGPEDLIIAIGAAYCITLLIISAGVYRLPKTSESKHFPKVSIIVTCRNEEQDLPDCINSLISIDYPKELLEIILVDDQSSDRTSEIIIEASSQNSNVVSLSTQGFQTNLKAKARGIALGANHAKGEWLFITDADGVVDPGWIKYMLSGTDSKTGLLGGVIMVQGNSLLAKLEKASLAFTQPFAIGFAGWGLPFICSGPNMAIRRDIYEKSGGLEEVDFEVAEDLALTNMAQSVKMRTKLHASPETTVRLKTVPSFGHLLSQQRRWVKGGFGQSLILRLPLAFVFGYHAMFSVVLLGGWFFYPQATLIAACLKLFADFNLLLSLKFKANLDKYLRNLPVMFVFTLFSFLWIPLSFLFSREIKWKGTGYEVKYD